MPNTAAQIIPPPALASRNVRHGMRFTPARNAANMRNSATKRPRNTTLAPVLKKQVLPEFDAGFKHANALAITQQEGVTVSQPEPVAGVVANDRAECGD